MDLLQGCGRRQTGDVPYFLVILTQAEASRLFRHGPTGLIRDPWPWINIPSSRMQTAGGSFDISSGQTVSTTALIPQ